MQELNHHPKGEIETELSYLNANSERRVRAATNLAQSVSIPGCHRTDRGSIPCHVICKIVTLELPAAVADLHMVPSKPPTPTIELPLPPPFPRPYFGPTEAC